MSEKKKTRMIQFNADVQIPSVPNFLRFGDGEGQMFDIAALTLDQLKQVGAAWTESLIERAGYRRKNGASS
jgi:hypothetical protein